LKDEEKVTAFQKDLGDRMRERGAESWKDIKTNICASTEKVLGKNILEPRKPWMTPGILELINERNKWRNEDYGKYKKIKNKITSECKISKDEWMMNNSKEIEYLLSKNRADKAYAKLKKLEYKPITRSNIVRDKEGKLLFENEKVAERWKEYLKELYEDEDIKEEEEEYLKREEDVEPDDKGPLILQDEYELALGTLSNKKAPGIDEIPTELLKNADPLAKSSLFNIVKESYECEIQPGDFIKRKSITIPKKGNASECANYRTITLLSHASNILLNILKIRIRSKIEEHIGEDQFGFRKEKGTREAIIALRQILERRLDVNLNTLISFIDL
jgi:hypothetical protein